MEIKALGYIGIQSRKLEAWHRYCTEFLGLMDVSAETSSQRFRIDGQAWRVSVQEGDSEDLQFVGFEAGDQRSLTKTCDQLRSLGYSVERDAHLARDRQVQDLYQTIDPDGLQIELYFGPTDCSAQNFVSPAGVSGFVTGEEGLGHIVLYTKDLAEKKRFYMDGLGFKMSDTIAVGPVMIHFLHCNPRHHTLALAEAPVGRHLNHFMIQAKALNDVGYANDRAIAMDIPMTAVFGCHTNDRMLSFYTQTPSGFDVEFGYGGVTIGDNWSVSHYNETSIWGHQRERILGSTSDG